MGVLTGYRVSVAAKTTSGPTAFERKLGGVPLMGRMSAHLPHSLLPASASLVGFICSHKVIELKTH